jgi:RES domain-containing protein
MSGEGDGPDIWAACGAGAPVVSLAGTLLRLVESQEQVATRRLVGSLEEQALLEELLEVSKPPLPASVSEVAGLHYLLATPFRYPPLRHGSRFGRPFEPSLFYAALTTPTVLAEAAYYRLVFWFGMASPPASSLSTQHTLFGAAYRTERGLRLTVPPFDAWQAALTDRAGYTATQRLGTAMREAGIAAFEYRSARDPAGGINLALFVPTALASPRPTFSQAWLGETGGEGVRFYCPEERQVFAFALADFTVDGRLPMPAV